MSNDYQEPMADGTDHPLKYVDPVVLDITRRTVRSCDDAIEPDEADPVADLVVLKLFQAGLLRLGAASAEELMRLRTRNMQLVTAMSAIRDMAEHGHSGRADSKEALRVIREACDEQIARGWADAE